ncbi:hypothetical protein [Anaerotignum sp.]|uniref:hypothetical protein n=1 Tax=Anaerotignum sp. TaxID=2039241 RepID=UPI0028A255C5|nr:hypothetical protein [Anaerotignum sp.]
MNEKAIGFRVTPTEIYYSIVANLEEEFEIISISKLKIPVSIDLPSQLSYIRNTISTIISQYQICYAGIKLIEGNARGSINNALIFRFNVEGGLMELFSNSTIRKYFLGVTSNIASVLKVKKGNAQEMLKAVVDIDNYKTDDNKKVSAEYKDAVIVALAAMEVGVTGE